MGIPVLILGDSGSGKSTSLRNFDPSEIGIFNVASKPLPFRKKMKVVDKAGYGTIVKALSNPKLKAKAGSAMTDGMLMPYRKVLDKAKAEAAQANESK